MRAITVTSSPKGAERTRACTPLSSRCLRPRFSLLLGLREFAHLLYLVAWYSALWVFSVYFSKIGVFAFFSVFCRRKQ